MLLGALQENLIVLLAYDDERAAIIRGLVEPQLFGGIHRTITARLYDYIDKFKKAPKDHLPDILMDKLEAENKREASLYQDTIESIHAAKDGINAIYVMSQLELFIKRQALRVASNELVKALQKDTEESLEEAETIIHGINTKQLSVFDPGTRLSDKTRALNFLDRKDSCFPTGIPELDKRGFGPTRKELWLFIANTKAGKSWLLIHLAKIALMHRLKICHISLEMTEDQCSQRYYQTLFSIAKRKDQLPGVKFEKDKLGRIAGFENVKITPTLSLDDPKIREKIEKRIDKWSKLDNIIIKAFPSGTLTMNHLRAYLDNLETSERFVPDLVILDYPDLMKLDADNMRLAIDQVYKEFRGIMGARNMAGAVVSQSHRAAAKSKLVGADNVAEAYSKIAHADTVITYTQTPHEHKLGLARLFVAAGRNDQDKIEIVISQQYGSGIFALDSCLKVGTYWENVRADTGEDDATGNNED